MVEKEGLEESIIIGTEKRKVYLRERIERGVIAICVFPEKKKRARSLPQLTCATWNLIVFNNQESGGLFLSKTMQIKTS